MTRTKSVVGRPYRVDDAGNVQWAETLVEDFRNGDGPFGNDPAPENTYIGDIGSNEDRARFLTFGAALDYQRPAERHWDTMWHMYEAYPELFVPSEACEKGERWLQSLFSAYGVRFPNRDSDTWQRIARILDDDHDGSVITMIEDEQYDAVDLMELVREGDFPLLGGVKICPFWIRLLHDHVHSLRNVYRVDIPVDVQVRRVTTELDGVSVEDDDDVREFWRYVGGRIDVPPFQLDEPLWQIGRYWDDWGEDYLVEVGAIT